MPATLPSPALDACQTRNSPTRQQILNTAERLFAERGLESVSVRDITVAAGVNLASINYHFGNKEGLIHAVLERRIVPINLARIAALDLAELAAAPDAVPLESLLDAFIRPVVSITQDSTRGGTSIFKMLGRTFSHVGPGLEDYIRTLCTPLFQRFDLAWQKALPGLTMDEIYWRVSFTHGAMNHWLLTRHKPVLDLISDPGSLEEQLQRLIQFSAAGLRAPMPTISQNT